jgi:Uma2 family endonuclease
MLGPMVAAPPTMTPEEYLAWERRQPAKHEYDRGRVFERPGGSLRHNRLCSELIGLLHDSLRPRGGLVLTSDQRVGLDRGERYVYPDVPVVCGDPMVEDDDILLNPTLVVEVLSLSTEQNDRGSKWQSYQRLPSLRDYVLVPQWLPAIEVFSRREDGAWSYRAARAGERVALATAVELAVDDLFAGAMDLPGDTPPPVVSG